MIVSNHTNAASTQADTWNSIQWEKVYATVKKLQVRIAKATRDKQYRKAKSLQWLLTHSYSAKCLAVKRVTTNKGKNTPGVDGVILKKPGQKAAMIDSLKRRRYKPLPLRRIYIPKPNGKKRPLGIPTMLDRCQQALHTIALMPIAETKADWGSYGFRPQRCTADAIERLFTGLNKANGAQWVLEGDIKGCFDNISHEWMLNNISMDTKILSLWLKAGYMESNALFPTDKGTPQGGIASPTLANLVLDGIEDLLGRTYGSFKIDGHRRRSGKHSVQFVRYADDFIVMAKSKEMLEHEIKPLIEVFLRERGLALSPEKTLVTHVSEGFDFLGQNIRRYNCGQNKTKILIKPSDKNVKNFLNKVRKIIKSMIGTTQADLIRELNPVIRGWANYHRSVVSKHTFTKVDHAIFWMLLRWGKKRHPNKSFRWIHNKYFRILRGRNHRFCAEEIDEKTKQPILWKLMLAEYIPIVRHVNIRGEANPFDPSYNQYFETRLYRKMANSNTGKHTLEILWKKQDGICPVCALPIDSVTGGTVKQLVSSTAGGTNHPSNLQLLHDHCRGSPFTGKKNW